MIIDPNTTIVDVALNLSGSLAGVPAVLNQLPAGERIGFDTLPNLGEDVDDIGQTWTPTLAGLSLDLSVPIYNVVAYNKAPYSTNIVALDPAIDWGAAMLVQLYNLQIVS